MIGSLRGEVLERWSEGTVLIDVGGVGYEVIVSPRTLRRTRADDVGVPLHPPPHPRGRPDALRVPHPRRALDVQDADRHARRRPGAGAGDPGHLPAGRARRRRRQRRLRRAQGGPRGRTEDGPAAARRAARPAVGAGARRRPRHCRRRRRTATSTVGAVREALAGLGYGADEIRDAVRELPGEGDAATLLRDALKLLGASVRDEFLDPGVNDDAEDAVEAGLRPRRLDEFVGQSGAEGAPRHRPRGGAAAPAGGRPPALRRTPGARQDDAGDDRRRRDGGAAAHHVRPGARARRRPRRHPHQARRPRRAVRRRDPPAVAGGRGDPLSGDGGLPARHRRRQGTGGVEHPPVAAAVHARRRDDPHGDDHRAAARPVRTGRPARLLRRRSSCRRSSCAPPGSSASASTTRGRGRSPAGRAARRGSPTGCCAACATSPRCAATGTSTRPPPSAGSPCSASTSSASTRSTAPCCGAVRAVPRRPGRAVDAGDRRRRADRDGRGRLRAVPHPAGPDRPHAARPGGDAGGVRAPRPDAAEAVAGPPRPVRLSAES